MSEILLAKPVLPPGFIDLSVGEPHVVRDILFEIFDMSQYQLPQVSHMWEYPASTGYRPLIKLLEDKHQAPVLVTNGAKQALGASFYALQKMGKRTVGMRNPYWALIPPLVKMHGLEPITDNTPAEAQLLLLPNNPDGFCPPLYYIKEYAEVCKASGMPLIHDAAYYTKTYLPPKYPIENIGDVQIYSISKMLGLSGLRLGYVVCHNKEMYKHIQDYIENMTVGVSIVSQMFLTELVSRMVAYPTLTNKFYGLSWQALQDNKKALKQINPEVLEIPDNVEDIAGMFGWFKVGPKANFAGSKINVIKGDLFGGPGMVRINLAFHAELMQEIINRLNAIKE